MSEFDELIERVIAEHAFVGTPTDAYRLLEGKGEAAIGPIESALKDRAVKYPRADSEEAKRALGAVNGLMCIYVNYLSERDPERVITFLKTTGGYVRGEMVWLLCMAISTEARNLWLRQKLHDLLDPDNEMERDIAQWMVNTGRLKADGLKLRMVGYWRENIEYPDGPDPKHLVSADWEESNRSDIVGYLKRGKISSQYLGFSCCRFKCGIPDSEMGDADLTDGIWVWPQGLSHYIERHSVVLPDAFVMHMKTNRYVNMCSLKRSDLETLEHDDNCWREWYARMLESHHI